MPRSLRVMWVAVLVSGCVSGRGPVAAPSATPVRAGVLDSAGSVLSSGLRGAGWEGEVTDTSRRGQTANNPNEQWDESSAQVTFVARRPDGTPAVLTTDELTAVMKGVRSDIRSRIQSAGGEVVDAGESEAYRERTLTVTYKVDKTTGVVRARFGPASDRPDETANLMELTVREQPAN